MAGGFFLLFSIHRGQVCDEIRIATQILDENSMLRQSFELKKRTLFRRSFLLCLYTLFRFGIFNGSEHVKSTDKPTRKREAGLDDNHHQQGTRQRESDFG